MIKERLYLGWLLCGLAIFGYFNFQVDWQSTPNTLTSQIGIGAWISGSILFLIEVVWSSLTSSDTSELDRAFLFSFFGASVVLGFALVWHAIASSQVWILNSLILGGILYSVLLRFPFRVLARVNG